MPKLRRPKFLRAPQTARQRAGQKMSQNGRFAYPKGIYTPLSRKALSKAGKATEAPRSRKPVRHGTPPAIYTTPASRRRIHLAQQEIERLERCLGRTTKVERARALETRLSDAQDRLSAMQVTVLVDEIEAA